MINFKRITNVHRSAHAHYHAIDLRKKGPAIMINLKQITNMHRPAYPHCITTGLRKMIAKDLHIICVPVFIGKAHLLFLYKTLELVPRNFHIFKHKSIITNS